MLLPVSKGCAAEEISLRVLYFEQEWSLFSSDKKKKRVEHQIKMYYLLSHVYCLVGMCIWIIKYKGLDTELSPECESRSVLFQVTGETSAGCFGSWCPLVGLVFSALRKGGFQPNIQVTIAHHSQQAN